jgi:hypothetical protein
VSSQESGLDPDPAVIHVNDLVVWEFSANQTSDVVEVKTPDVLLKYSKMAADILPRRYLSRSFKDPGAFHFVSPSFDTTINPHLAANDLDVGYHQANKKEFLMPYSYFKLFFH